MDITDGHTLPHKKKVDLDMLRAVVLNQMNFCQPWSANGN
jgi:hypothetical protein